MAKHQALLFSLCFLLALFHSGFASRQQGRLSSHHQQQNIRMLNQIQAREPDNRIETEAGRIDSWDHTQDDFQCVGVAVKRITIERNDLHLPYYTNSPRLAYVVHGMGHLGLVFPGCPETFEESEQSFEEQQQRQQQQSRRKRHLRREGSKQGEQQEEFDELDRHQRVRVVKQGYVIAIPAGVTTWAHNHGDEALVVVIMLDMSNKMNQLDQNPRKFFLAGNSQDEFDFSQQGQQSQWKLRQHGQSRSMRHPQQDCLLVDVESVDEETGIEAGEDVVTLLIP